MQIPPDKSTMDIFNWLIYQLKYLTYVLACWIITKAETMLPKEIIHTFYMTVYNGKSTTAVTNEKNQFVEFFFGTFFDDYTFKKLKDKLRI